MKHILLVLGLCAASLDTLCAEPAFSRLTECQLAGALHSVSLLRGQPILDDYVYRIQQSRKSAFLYEDLDSSRGSNVHWRCIALKKGVNVLLVTGEFSSNYLQSVLFHYDQSAAKVRRISSTERNRPGWIGLTRHGPQVIYENTGLESPHRYLIYGPHETYLELDSLPTFSGARGEVLMKLSP
ncbi:hypothetical protein KVG96_13725 [Pseudomonas sp. COR58]|uniref:Uncharacterized protein n=1 Tax=Pseudomonas ekonensis TaxID=2842353 RepID=A0ABS6PEW9_9PSED|nr:hypothetical protein [Pseudomonas ekonensis]MBV4459015.1 hypothetical protein [Pseudomonas ekonensis]